MATILWHLLIELLGACVGAVCGACAGVGRFLDEEN